MSRRPLPVPTRELRTFRIGHTHMPEHDERCGFQIFNPGSPTERRRAPAHTMGLATVSGGRVTFELVAVG